MSFFKAAKPLPDSGNSREFIDIAATIADNSLEDKEKLSAIKSIHKTMRKQKNKKVCCKIMHETGSGGFTLLHFAAQYNALLVAEWLFNQYKLSPRKKDIYGRSAENIAANYGHNDFLKTCSFPEPIASLARAVINHFHP